LACGGTGFDPVSVSLAGGLPFPLDSLLFIDELPAVEIAVVPEKRRLFFHFCSGDGVLMSIIKHLSRHVDLKKKRGLRNAA
jgi:hypothetical protein